MRGRQTLVVLCALALFVVAPAAARTATTPQQRLAASLAAAKAASSVHIVGANIVTGGTRISLDLRLVAGKGGAGWIQLGKNRIGIIQYKSFVYFRAGPAFWTQYGGATAAQLFAGRWVKAPTSNADLASFTTFTDVGKFFSGILGSHGKLAAGGQKTIDGHAAVGVIDTSKSGGGTLWIAARGTPYPLELTESGGPGLIKFEGWNAPEHVGPPKNAIDLSKLKSK